jgi:hypothetical protein
MKMNHDTEIERFLDQTLDHAVREAAIYGSGFAVHEVTAANALALAVFAFTAKTTRDVEIAEKAEAEFRRRVALLSEPHEAMH